MPWTELQRRMLVEMGLPSWLAPAAAPGPAPIGVGGDAPAERAEPAERAAARPATDTALTPAIADMDWPTLDSTIAGCTACGLCQGRTRAVTGMGHRAAHWMVVGEPPGEEEDHAGEPFAGRPGQLLDNMLRALQLTRGGSAGPERQVFVTNTVKCRPPGNRNPTLEELATCESFLLRQVALVRPRLILAMGRFAVQSLLHSTEPIGRLRGRVHHCHGVPLIVTHHPGYLLRHPEEKARAWEDLCLAADTIGAAAAVASA